ncbi:MAG TPA: protein-glutamate O-methyltransferase CheR [Thermodesulfobacteriota bacterium]|nr:protein-glutamate O-methyltransferase CheR [Thermodesulfobacteriota bacterium]
MLTGWLEPQLPMSLEEFRQIRDLIHAHCGIYFDEHSKYLLERRLGRLALARQCQSFGEYYRFLKYHRERDAEMNAVLDVLTTNETYFFREAFQLKAFAEEILPELLARGEARGERRLRIWSAGCSSGEEPYTIAMLVIESGRFDRWQVDIIGTDISQRVLQLARAGVYQQPSMRQIEERYIHRFFDVTEVPGRGRSYRIKDEVRRYVNFAHLNLLDAGRVALLPMMDVIFCRNVIIYFDQGARRAVVDQFHRKLLPGGYLLLGHSESLVNLSTAFVLRHLKHDMVYQKPVAADGVPVR